jgi:hypothetical protein
VKRFSSVQTDTDMIRILGMVARGLTEGQDSTSLSTKEHSSLQELVALGLVQFKGSLYSQTALGKELFRTEIDALGQNLISKTGERLHRFSSKKKSSSDYQNGIDAQTLAKELIEDLECSAGITDLHPDQIFNDWLSLSLQTALLINKMKHEIIVATRYMDFRTAEIAVNQAKLGRKIRILHSDRNQSSTKLQLLGNLMSNPRAASAYEEFSNHPNIQTGEAEIPFSFIVVDRHSVEIEIINPEDPDTFFLAFYLESHVLAEKLIWLFDDMARTSREDELRRNLSEMEIKKSTKNEITR